MESEKLPVEERETVHLVPQSLSALEVEHDRENRRLVAQPKKRSVFEHAPREVPLGSGLDLDVNENELWLHLQELLMSEITLSVPDEALAALKVTPEEMGAELRLAAAVRPFAFDRLHHSAR